MISFCVNRTTKCTSTTCSENLNRHRPSPCVISGRKNSTNTLSFTGTSVFSPFRIMLHLIRVSVIYQRRCTILPLENLVQHSDSYFIIKPVITINLQTQIKGINSIEKYKINTKVKLNY